jgi:hypothetical protein
VRRQTSGVHPMLDRRCSAPPYRAGDLSLPGAREASRLVALGALRVVLQDVHAPSTVRDTFTLRLTALRLVVPPQLRDGGAVVCLDTAVWLFAGGPAPALVDVALPPGSARPRARGLRVHELRYGARDLWPPLPDDPVTSPARTAADMARRLPGAQAVPLLAALGLVTGLRPGQVHAMLAGLQGRGGVRRAQRSVIAWSELMRPASPVPPVPRKRSVHPVAGHPVGVEDALDPADGVDHVVEMPRGRHLEGEPRDGDAVA